MAGLLDILGTSGVDTMGLLGMSPAEIQRNRDDAQAQALYALAGRLFQGGNTGASIAQGLQQGQQAYSTAMKGNVQDLLQNTQLQEMLRKREQEQKMRELAPQIFTTTTTPEQVTYQGQPSQFPARDDQGNMMPDMAIKLLRLQELLTQISYKHWLCCRLTQLVHWQAWLNLFLTCVRRDSLVVAVKKKIHSCSLQVTQQFLLT